MGDKNTKSEFVSSELRQIVVLVRYKPGNAGGLGGAESMLGGVAGAASAVSSAVDSVASYVPGFIKEDKAKEKQSDKEYNYFKEYDKGWDKKMKEMDKTLAEMNDKNKVLIHDFEEADTEDKRKQEGDKLYNKIQSEIASWADYPSAIHFIGLGQGGNIANEAASKFKDHDQLKKDKWHVKSVIYVGTPLYQNIHQLDKEVLKGKGKQIALGNRYDLTQHAIEYFEPADKLRKYIAECNSNTFSYFTGTIMMRLVQALAYVLGNHELGVGKDNSKVLDAFEKAKDEITGMIEDLVGMIKKLAKEAPGLINMDDLPEFSKMMNGYGDIPGESKKRITDFIEDDLKKMISGTSVSTSKLPLEKFFNFLVPLFTKLTDTLKLFTIESKTTDALLNQVFEKAGVEKIHAPGSLASKPVEVDENYTKILQQKLDAKKPELGAVMVNDARKSIADATRPGETDLKKLPAKEKAAAGAAITAMTLSMLPTKKALYAKLLSYLPLSGPLGFMEKLTADKAAGPLKSLVGNIRSGFDFDPTDSDDPKKIGLKAAIARFDGEMKRIRGYLDSKNFPIDDQLNSLYFIYNSHNLMLKDMYSDIRMAIDNQTTLDLYMKSKNFEYDRVNNIYVKKGDAEKENVKPVEPAKEKETANA